MTIHQLKEIYSIMHTLKLIKIDSLFNFISWNLFLLFNDFDSVCGEVFTSWRHWKKHDGSFNSWHWLDYWLFMRTENSKNVKRALFLLNNSGVLKDFICAFKEQHTLIEINPHVVEASKKFKWAHYSELDNILCTIHATTVPGLAAENYYSVIRLITETLLNKRDSFMHDCGIDAYNRWLDTWHKFNRKNNSRVPIIEALNKPVNESSKRDK